MSAHAEYPVVNLTVIRDDQGKCVGTIGIKTSQLLSYEQRTGYTHLRISGGVCLDVREGTDEIDRRVRQAASQANSLSQ